MASRSSTSPDGTTPAAKMSLAGWVQSAARKVTIAKTESLVGYVSLTPDSQVATQFLHSIM